MFKFYVILMDLCASTDLGPIELGRYFDQSEQIGEYIVTNHDRILKKDREEVFKLKEKFISKIVEYCRGKGPLTHEQLLLRRFGQIPVGMDPWELSVKVYFYNPDGLKGIHEVENPIKMCEGLAVAPEAMIDPCLAITVNGDTYFIPQVYISDADIEVIPDRTIDDL